MARRGGRGRLTAARLAKARDKHRIEREEALRAALDAIIEPAMLSRGFTRHDARPGHWRSVGGYGHDLEFRHRTLHNWMEDAYRAHGADAALQKLVGKVDGVINVQVKS